MSGQDQVTIMSSRANGGSGGTSTSAARVILQTSGPQANKIVSQQGPPPLTSIVLSTSAASKMLGNKDHPSPSSKVAELSSTKHRVKQLLETYSMTAEKSLMGPEEAAYSKFDQSYSGMWFRGLPISLLKKISNDKLTSIRWICKANNISLF